MRTTYHGRPQRSSSSSSCLALFCVVIMAIVLLEESVTGSFLVPTERKAASSYHDRISLQTRSTTIAMLMASNNNNNNKASFDSLEELDQARRRFEALFAEATNESSVTDSHKKIISSSPRRRHRPMTTSSRRRRELEIELLQSLQDSDDATEELVVLWMTERGLEKAQLLQDMQEECSVGLVVEESILRQLQHDHDDDNDNDDDDEPWLEASFRLAMLLYYKGKTVESKQLCWHVLANKPWHFEAAHLALMQAFREGNDADVWKWARQRLPPLNPTTNNARRKRWVQTAVAQARASLEHAEWELLQWQCEQEQQQILMQQVPTQSSSLPTEENTFC